MDFSPPLTIIRLGSHAEKEYVVKLINFLDGLAVGANLLEGTPGATASLLLKAESNRTRVYIDPMTYAFGEYVEHDGTFRKDLDWIKSWQTRKDKNGRKRKVRDFKRSYKSLAELLGRPIRKAVQQSVAVSPAGLDDEAARADLVYNVLEYQAARIAWVFEEEEELREFAAQAPKPAALFAPYFYIEPRSSDQWLDANIALMTAAAAERDDFPIHGVICADAANLANSSWREALVAKVAGTGVAGLWLWFSGFFEERASEEQLAGYLHLVESVSGRGMEVYARHGGFLSLALREFGMTGVSHGIGYGEQKDVIPVIGQSIPTVRYYMPPLCARLGVPDIERAFDAMEVETPEDFYEKVCGCVVCRGVVSSSLAEFQAFGEMHRSRSESKRLAQTPAAAKRCRFHYLLTRIKERDELRSASRADIAQRLVTAADTWGAQPSINSQSGGLKRWAKLIASEEIE